MRKLLAGIAAWRRAFVAVNATRAGAAILLTCLGAPLVLAQEVEPTLRVHQRDIAPGLNAIQATQNAPGGAMHALTLKTDLQTENVRLELRAFPGRAAEAPLGSFLNEQTDSGALAIAASADGRAVDGLYFNGTLWSWPSRRVMLVMASDETPRLQDNRATATAVLTFDNGTTMTITSLNGGPADEGAVLFSDPFASKPPTGWAENTLAISLTPPKRGNRALWDDAIPVSERWWKAGKPEKLESARRRSGDYLLVIPEADDATSASLATAERVSINFPLVTQIKLSLFSADVGEWFVRDGQMVGESTGPREIRNFIGVDSSRRQIWLTQNGTAESGRQPFSQDRLVRLMQRENARDVVVLDGGGERLLVRSEQRDSRLAARGITAQAALVAGQGEMRLQQQVASLKRLQLAWAVGSDSSEAQNRPEAAIDNHASDDVTLEGFWAAPVTKRQATEEMPWLEIGLAQRSIVQAIDVMHAETSGFSPQFNLAAYRILGREDNQQPWRELAVVEHETPQAIERIAIDYGKPLIAVRIEVIRPNFLAKGNTARISEVLAWGEVFDREMEMRR